MATNAVQLVPGVAKNHSPQPTMAIAIARFTMCWPPNTIGAPLMRPDNLKNAITEPENVIAPTNVPMKSSSLLPAGIDSPAALTMPKARGLLTAAIAINTAARPTSECMKATSSGMAVICTLRATTAPMAPPSAMPPIIITQFLVSVSVTDTAIAMPIMPNRLPRREVSGDDRPFNARMKKTEATRYASAI